ncbi:MAG: gamma-glutamyl-gamma-aminobutyrate hydrolase family protein [candidate division WOR-3 bacterium]|nr:MAG: gamma-glutamyl-gamma-aminobutyrate hydrolase family protein [candidate division WOR-3 bacterium]
MRTLIIDNYLPNSPQLEHLYNVIKDITVHTVEIMEYSSIHPGEEFKQYDVFVLSGSQHKLAESEVFESYLNEGVFLKNIKKPVLGICFGHQLIARAFGEEIATMDSKYEGYYIVNKIENDPLFAGLNDKFFVTESHEEMVVDLPNDFILLADSPNCHIEVIRHQVYPIYGVQFHPERFDEKHPAGYTILENFFKVATW